MQYQKILVRTHELSDRAFNEFLYERISDIRHFVKDSSKLIDRAFIDFLYERIRDTRRFG